MAADESMLRALLRAVPTGWGVLPSGGGDGWRFEVRRASGRLTTVDGAGVETERCDIQAAQRALREELRRYVGFHTPELFFIHAGVVACRNSVIVMPGHSFAGKSTLVRALLSAGAEFYSDEYAIFNRDGHVIQYREPLIARGPNGREETEIVAEGPDRPLPVSLVAVTSYRDGAKWAPREGSAAEGVIALMEHASRARPRAAEAIATFKLALRDATVLVGERGDADETAAALLEAAESRLRPEGRA